MIRSTRLGLGGGLNILEDKELGDFLFKIPIKVGWVRIAGWITWYFFKMFFWGRISYPLSHIW